MSDLIKPSEFQFCCGTSCNAKANMEYVKRLEAELLELEDRNSHLVTSICSNTDKLQQAQLFNDELATEIEVVQRINKDLEGKAIEDEMTIKSRDRALRIATSTIRNLRIQVLINP